jgi:hypothetical protein
MQSSDRAIDWGIPIAFSTLYFASKIILDPCSSFSITELTWQIRVQFPKLAEDHEVR